MWPFRRAREDARESVDEQVLRDLLADARRWIARYAGPRADLDDLVQESMIELVVALERFRGDSSVRTYAHRIVLRTTARELAKRRTTRAHIELVGEIEREGQGGDPERALSDRRTMARFYEALSALSEKRRNAFVLCAIEKLAHDEAAAIEGVSVETLRARLKHARADLERALAGDPLLGSYVAGGER
ncbi:RNA polymerase sigma factor [Sandaracinus amylolyticus]|uniref:RNA polymerase sigma factor n=1 Tax=Sandaracinus amylolyticus TaxID=927083 RepID=UPI001F28D199|nr:sigma-70 family RNA polymerase sigma factor [Sandaracinus amylolyticus]UJR81429.1 RNA polymerase sigma factor RpoE [Sandaracinus amylolyticus]